MKRLIQAALCRHPRVYLRVLSALGRGGVEKRAFLSLVRSNDVVFDIGANEGYFTSLFSDMVRPRGAVHAFEPVAATFAQLSRRIQPARSGANVRLVQAACSDSSGTAEIVVPAGDGAQASLAVHAEGSWSQPGRAAERVKTVRLDEYLDAARLTRIDVLKCDAEGAELTVLRGLGTRLASLCPLVCLELCPAWMNDFGCEPGDLIDLLREAGYDRFFTVHDAIAPAGRDEACRLAAQHGSINVIAARERVHAERLATLRWSGVLRPPA